MNKLSQLKNASIEPLVIFRLPVQRTIPRVVTTYTAEDNTSRGERTGQVSAKVGRPIYTHGEHC